MSNALDLPLWLQPLASALDSANLLARSGASLVAPFSSGSPPEIEWQSDGRNMAEMTTMSLRVFAPEDDDRIPVLIEAPFAIHDAGIVDLAHGHSIVETFRARSARRLAVTVWRSATPGLGELTIDSYLADLNAAVDLLGGRVDLVGLCQGGWMALVYAAAFPQKVRRLGLVGTPVDTEAAPSIITMAAKAPGSAWLEPLMAGAGLVNTRSLFYGLIATTSQDGEVAASLQIEPSRGGAAGDAARRFQQWNWRNYELPSAYFAQVNQWIFQENRIAKGTFPVFGRPVTLASIRSPLFIMAADQDSFAPSAQSLGLAGLVGTPADCIVTRLVSDCCHLGLFLGRRTLRDVWPEMISFLDEA